MVSAVAPADIVKLPAMDSAEIEALLAGQKICRMALNDEPQPYIIALDYVYIDGKLYFHFADYGRKMDLIRKDPHVGVEVDNFCAGSPDFKTVSLRGRLARVTDEAEKQRAARQLLSSADERGGAANVAARHGFRSLDSATLASPGSALYRLDVDGCVALKSPGR